MKNKFTATLPLAFLAIGMLGSVTSVNADDLNNSIFVPLDPPCRVGDTRGTSTPSIPADGHVEWFAYGTDMSDQGGNGAGCFQPKEGMTPTGISVNIAVYGPLAEGRGNLVAYPADASAPTAAILNYYPVDPALFPSPNISNSTIVSLCQEGDCDGKFKIQANNAAVPVIADVQGYFYARPSGVAHVAVRGGDYSSPIDAMTHLADWCGTPAPDNHCLIDVAPGTYDLGIHQLVMQEHVDMRGAGRLATNIIGTVSTTSPDETSALIVAVSNCNLSDFKMVNFGGSNFSIGIFIKSGNPNISRVNVAVFGGSVTSYGMFNVGSPIVKDVIVSGVSLGGDYAYGVWFNDDGGTWSDVTARGTGGQVGNAGVYIHKGAVNFRESTMEGSTRGPGVVIDDRVNRNNNLVNNMIIGGVKSNLSAADAKQVCLGNYDSDLSPVDCKK